MSVTQKLLQFFAVPNDPELVQAQARAFSRQIPLLYANVLVNTLLLAASVSAAPDLLRFYIPGLLTLLCLVRMAMWLRARKLMNHPEARRLLRSVVVVSGVLGLAFSAWALSLYPYGDAAQRGHVAFYITLTSICGVFCLMHLRAAAAVMALSMLAPFVTFFMASGNTVLMAVAVTLLMTVSTMLWVLFANYRDFGALVASRAEMAAKQAETQRLSDENYQLANVDSLTGLPNQRSFERHLHAMLAKAHASGYQIAVARLNLDSFKAVNDIFGQITGDRVLNEVARRINGIRRPSSLLVRLGADNFGLILGGPTDEANLRTCGEALTRAMRQSFDLTGANIHLSASAGFAASRPGDTAETLFDRADYATSVAKREARGGVVVFSERHALDISRVRRMEHALRSADLDAEIYILFQPQFDILLNRTTGYEVLARWRSPLLGEISPGDFIPLAERTGMISKITQTVLRKALMVSERLPKSLRLSVNLSAHDLGSATTIEAIVALVNQVGTPCRVDFEITETAVMHDINQASAGLVALLALGSRIALDDFGTGHSSLTHVQKLPLHQIKVDRSFVAEVTNDPTSRAIIKTTVDLCRNLGITCVFEGIETEQQLDVLLGLGGTIMQGYLFGRPMTEDMVGAYLASEQEQLNLSRPASQNYSAAH